MAAIGSQLHHNDAPLVIGLNQVAKHENIATKASQKNINAAHIIERAVEAGFAANRIRPMEFGGDMGTRAVTNEVVAQLST